MNAAALLEFNQRFCALLRTWLNRHPGVEPQNGFYEDRIQRNLVVDILQASTAEAALELKVGTVLEIGGGYGQLSMWLALNGQRCCCVESQTLRVEGARWIAEQLQLPAAIFELHCGVYPSTCTPPCDAVIAANIIGGWWQDWQAPPLEKLQACLRGKPAVIDIARFGEHLPAAAAQEELLTALAQGGGYMPARVQDSVWKLLPRATADGERCPLCEAPAPAAAERFTGTHRWYRCTRCDLLWEGDLSAARKQSYTVYWADAGRWPSGRGPTEYDASEPKISDLLGSDPAMWYRAYEAIEREVAPWLKDRELLLEVGFGAAPMLDHAAHLGLWQRIAGLEICPDYVAFARSKGHSVHYFDVSLDAPGGVAKSGVAPLLNNGSLVITSEVMEHMRNPVAFAAGLRRFLKPTGLWWTKFWDARGLPRLASGEWQYWSQPAIEWLMRTAGFKILAQAQTDTCRTVVATRAN